MNQKLYIQTLVSIIFILTSMGFVDGTTDIDISISKNDIVTEHITKTIMSNRSYESIEFTTLIKPLSILFDGDFSIIEKDLGYTINFFDSITPGINIFTFTLLYDSIIEKNGPNKVFKTSFYPEDSDQVTVSLTLPLYHVLSEKKPSMTPRANFIESDGQRITLYWKFYNEDHIDIVVFYRSEKVNMQLFIFPIVFVLIVSFASYHYFRKKAKEQVFNILSGDEIKIIEELRKGVTKQKDIAQNLAFSKSKMSKVLRKLEEKCLIIKKPFFKTNILRLTSKIK